MDDFDEELSVSGTGIRPSSRCGSTASTSSTVGSRPGTAEKMRPPRAKPRGQEPPRSGYNFKTLCDMVGFKAAQKHKTVRDCFRRMDCDHNGRLSLQEMLDLFRSFSLQPDLALQFFQYMDTDGSGEIDFDELRMIIGPYIQPGYRPPKPKAKAQAQTDNVHVASHKEEELSRMAQMVGTKAQQRHQSCRECFRFLDNDKDGVVTNVECLKFFESIGVERASADRIYRLLPKVSKGVRLRDFMDIFGPHMHMDYAHTTSANRLNQRRARPSSAPCGGRPASARGVRANVAPHPPTGRPATASGVPAATARRATVRTPSSAARKAAEVRAASAAYHSQDNVPAFHAEASTESYVSSDEGELEGPRRAEVLHGPRGGFSWMPDAPKTPSSNRTWDSSGFQQAMSPRGVRADARRHSFTGPHRTPVTARGGPQRQPAETRSGLRVVPAVGEFRSEDHDHHGNVILTPGRHGDLRVYKREDGGNPIVASRSAWGEENFAQNPAAGVSPHAQPPAGSKQQYTDHRGMTVIDVTGSGAGSVAASMGSY